MLFIIRFCRSLYLQKLKLGKTHSSFYFVQNKDSFENRTSCLQLMPTRKKKEVLQFIRLWALVSFPPPHFPQRKIIHIKVTALLQCYLNSLLHNNPKSSRTSFSLIINNNNSVIRPLKIREDGNSPCPPATHLIPIHHKVNMVKWW